MKRYRYLIAVAIILFPLLTGVSAQTGIGARGIFGVSGNSYGGAELSLQKLGRHEFDVGWANDSWKFTGLKLLNFIPARNFGLYGGAGAGIGYTHRYDEFFGNFALDLGTYILIGPIQLGLDWRPEWNLFNYPGNDLSFNLALSGRLVFGARKLDRGRPCNCR
jgi:hypothetical protein